MSVETLAVVLHHSRAKGTAKLVLVGIANHDGDGGSFPKIATLAKYANVHPRRVAEAINTLGELGELIVHHRDGGTRSVPDHLRPNRYEIPLTCPDDCDRTKNHRITGERLARTRKGTRVPGAVDKPENGRPEAVDNHTPDPVTETAPGDENSTGTGDENVTTKNHHVEPPIESGLVCTSPDDPQAAAGEPTDLAAGVVLRDEIRRRRLAKAGLPFTAAKDEGIRRA